MAISKPSGGVAADGGVAAGIGATPRSARAVAQGLGGKGRAYKGTGEGGCAVRVGSCLAGNRIGSKPSPDVFRLIHSHPPVTMASTS
jgi:hypothetical protein